MRTTEEVLAGRNLIDFLYKCRKDFKFFAEELLIETVEGIKIEIQPFQLEWVEMILKSKKVMIQAPSGFAKTTILEMFVTWLAWKEHDKKIMILANTEDRAKKIIDHISSFMTSNELILDLKPKNYRDTWNKQELKTSTRCLVFAKPFTPNMRGERSDFTLVDEADAEAFRDIKTFEEHVLTRLNPGSKIVLISTPDSSTGLMSYLLDTDKNKLWTFKKYQAIVNMKIEGDFSTGESLWPSRFSLEELLERMESMGKDAILKIYMCDEKAENRDSIFKLRDIMHCYDEAYSFESKPTDGIVILACDFAISDSARADFDAYVVVEKKNNVIIIRHIEIHKGIKTPWKAERIKELHKQYCPQILVCDKTNIGSDVIDDLYAKGIAVIEQGFTPAERKDLLLTLKSIIENKKLVIPRNPDEPEQIELTNLLTEQLLGYVEQESITNKSIKILKSTSPHDDVAISLAMAVKEATNQITEKFY